VVREGAVESSSSNQSSISKWRVLNLRIVSVTTAQTARRDDRGDAAAIGQPRVQNGLRFGDVVTKAAGRYSLRQP